MSIVNAHTPAQFPATDAGSHLANFDVAPDDHDVAGLRENVATIRGVIASPVPVFGRLRRFASRLGLPVRPSNAELELREQMLGLLRSYDHLLELLDPSSHTTGDNR